MSLKSSDNWIIRNLGKRGHHSLTPSLGSGGTGQWEIVGVNVEGVETLCERRWGR